MSCVAVSKPRHLRSATMDDEVTITGPRASLVNMLNWAAAVWWHFGEDLLTQQAEAAARRLSTGQPFVRVGHTVYRVG